MSPPISPPCSAVPNSSQTVWSNNPYAPQISRPVYLNEKANFAGNLIGAILYGIVVTLFFQCIGTLIGPENRTKNGIKWGLVAHTVAMFSIVTVYTAAALSILSISYIDNREFPCVDGALPLGPIGYQYLTYSNPTNVVVTVMFLLNNWLADGLLLYRCYVVYTRNLWATAFPFLIYLGSLATGVVYIYRASQPVSVLQIRTTIKTFGIPHHSISVSLNVLLTLMIAARLMLHSKRVRDSMGASSTATRLYKTIVTILIESCALFAISFVLFVGPWVAGYPAADVFFLILVQTQVIAPFLVTLRVANRNAITSETIVSGTTASINFEVQRMSAVGDGSLQNGHSRSSVDTCGETPRDLGITIDLHPDK